MLNEDAKDHAVGHLKINWIELKLKLKNTLSVNISEIECIPNKFNINKFTCINKQIIQIVSSSFIVIYDLKKDTESNDYDSNSQ